MKVQKVRHRVLDEVKLHRLGIAKTRWQELERGDAGTDKKALLDHLDEKWSMLVEQGVNDFGRESWLGGQRLRFEFTGRSAVTATQLIDAVFPVMTVLKANPGQGKLGLALEVVSIAAVDHVPTVAAFVNIDGGHVSILYLE
ncbi:hypothetical protein [Pseudomonas vanderleydeniana]|uniref:Uncharacterized protein n=1 Tax=Pseudomonas vanderleydeniana TaxID=2745495 RepID=A0A9E6TNZ1_9PSED|nr:hypothetical protein [Pseudomonas vanderleydeniana]QXI25873.1 hypothetical protein HU752_018050 [Pseudomonas vanderleydeniana]